MTLAQEFSIKKTLPKSNSFVREKFKLTKFYLLRDSNEVFSKENRSNAIDHEQFPKRDNNSCKFLSTYIASGLSLADLGELYSYVLPDSTICFPGRNFSDMGFGVSWTWMYRERAELGKFSYYDNQITIWLTFFIIAYLNDNESQTQTICKSNFTFRRRASSKFKIFHYNA